MQIKNFNEISDVFEIGTELNLGVFPDSNVVKYGYSYNNEFILYLQGIEKIDKIKDYLETYKHANFYKWSSKGKMVNGEGNATILETKEEKINCLKYIMKQQKTNNDYIIKEGDLENIFVFKILVEKIYRMY
jgi:hypothetical protein